MGQTHSTKDNPTPSTHELAPTPRPNKTSPSTQPLPPPSPTQFVSPPAPPRAITRMSELIDPEDLILYEEEARMNEPLPPLPSELNPKPRLMVESPSGNLLSAAEFRGRQDRKLTVAERKEAIREETRRKIAMQPEAQAEAEAEAGAGADAGAGLGPVEGQDGERKKMKKCCALGGFLRTCGCCGIGRGRGD